MCGEGIDVQKQKEQNAGIRTNKAKWGERGEGERQTWERWRGARAVEEEVEVQVRQGKARYEAEEAEEVCMACVVGLLLGSSPRKAMDVAWSVYYTAARCGRSRSTPTATQAMPSQEQNLVVLLRRLLLLCLLLLLLLTTRGSDRPCACPETSTSHQSCTPQCPRAQGRRRRR